MQDVNDLRQHLIDVWVGVEQSVNDDGIDQWRRRLHACILATRGYEQKINFEAPFCLNK